MAVSPHSPIRSVRLQAALALAGLLVAALCFRQASQRISTQRYEQRGVATAELPAVSAAVPQTYGVNISLERSGSAAAMERDLRLAREMGFRWVRQRFPWAQIEPEPGVFDWQRWDILVAEVQTQRLALIAVLDTPPSWARSPADAEYSRAPPQYVSTYGLFVRALAERYRGQIACYQIWDQPNISPNWGNRDVDAAGYVRLLRLASEEIRRADPQALILSAALASTTEQGGRNLSEVAFLSSMYDAGARGLFDVLGAKLYGFWSGPEDRRVDPAVLNFSRAILLREQMVSAGDGDTPIWAVEYGWNSLATDWTGGASPWGTDTGDVQSDRVLRAVTRARSEWAWLGLMCWAQFRPAAPPSDPVWGFAVLGPCYLPTGLYDAVEQSLSIEPVRRAPESGYDCCQVAIPAVAAVLALMASAILAAGTPWKEWLRKGQMTYRQAPEWTPWLALALAWAVFHWIPWSLGAVAALAVAAAVVAASPDVGLAYLVFFIPLFLHSRPVFGKNLSVVELLTWMCCVGYGWRWIARRRWWQSSGWQDIKMWLRARFRTLVGLDWAVAAFVVLAVLSLRVSLHKGVSLRELRVVVLEPALLYLLLRQARLSEKQRVRLVDALVAAGVAVSCYGLYQYFVSGDVIAAEGVRRIRSVYASPNNLSLLLGRIVPFGVAMILAGKGRRGLGYALSLAPMMVCLVLTYSRGALLLAIPVGLVVIGWLRRRRSTAILLLVVIAGIVLASVALGPQRISGLLTLEEGTTFRRIRLWESAVEMIRDYPISGIGMDNFLYRYPEYIRPDAWQEPGLSHPHNLVLDFWTRLGIGGPAVLIWLLAAFFVMAIRRYRCLEDGNGRAIILGSLASMAGAVAHGVIDNSYFLVDLAFVFFLSLGLVRTSGRACQPAPESLEAGEGR